ncbi:VOC family protein [Dysgonomonas sp.]|jgi:predicted 3-demethylubiquinone-9 3-methyltransferase (glyoxalase superfamily)|nr:VOC family protein [Prevotella sp.]
MAAIQKITPNLWFDTQAEEAAKFYVSIFNNSKIGAITRFGQEGFEYHKMPEGTVMTVNFWIEGVEFIALNGGPAFKFNESISFIINCDTQDEVDYFWNNLIADGGEESMCGWLKDKFGLSWQVVPVILNKMMTDPDAQKVKRVSNAIFQMRKLNIGILKRAYEGAD